MKKYIISLILLFLCSNCFGADVSIQKVEIYPLSGGVSFNTITFADKSITGWVTAPSVEMIGRKEIEILNTSSTDNLFITGVSGSTTVGTIYPRESRTFKAASNLQYSYNRRGYGNSLNYFIKNSFEQKGQFTFPKCVERKPSCRFSGRLSVFIPFI